MALDTSRERTYAREQRDRWRHGAARSTNGRHEPDQGSEEKLGGGKHDAQPDGARDASMQDGATREQVSKGARGRDADTPRKIPMSGLRDVALRLKSELTEDQIPIVSAGVAFFAFLAVFPGLAALVSIYGLVADPTTVREHLMGLTGTIPSEARKLLQDFLTGLTSGEAKKLGVGVIVGIVAALWSANSGMKTLLTALNIAYDEKESRNFFKLNGTSLLLTTGAVGLVLVAIGAVVVVPAVLNVVGLGSFGAMLVKWLRWPLLAFAMLMGLAVLYRYGPDRAKPKWRWVSWGSGIATALWLGASALFSLYVSKFASYDKTYGSLGAVVILLMYLYLSSLIVIIGAELNGELEHQTARDSTSGPEKPLGQRHAQSADTVGATP